MNNYLGRLIARSRGELPTLQPLLPGRFEPTQGHDLAPAEPALMATPAVPPAPAQAGLSAAVIDTLSQFMPDRAASDIPPAASADIAKSTQPPPLATASAEPTATKTSASASVAANAHIPSAASPQPALHSTVPAPAIRVDMDQARVAPRRTGPTLPAMLDAASDGTTPASFAPQAVAALAVSSQVQVQRPRVAAGQNGSKAPALSEHHETVVHVTIGRVDVRAVATPAAKSAPRQESPRRSSLDDYLRGSPRR
ncbi:hypothetical protein [Dyella silvatica]|uniref:hypothetical protein n=1 Tax=Dyella silvatica TaxID=2992128 RepID=UPI00225B776C|nr:hypothetical protein [Dyella silvatica]